MTPGWYPDPQGTPLARWWDGGQWTPQVADPVQVQALEYQRRAARNTGFVRNVILTLIALVVGVLFAAMVITAVMIHG